MTQESTPQINVTEVLNAIEKWINRRPGLDSRDYGTGREGLRAYRSELRSISKDRARAMQALREARNLFPYDPAILSDSFRAFSGRLEWRERPYDGCPCDSGCCARCKANPSHELHYTTGQYWPTEYRKAAASVLETYCSGWKAAYAKEHPPSFVYSSMSDVITANEQVGGHWFDKSSMRFFQTKIKSRLIAGKRFITSERGPDERTRYTIREAQPDGSIDTVGEFQQFSTLEDAKAKVLMVS